LSSILWNLRVFRSRVVNSLEIACKVPSVYRNWAYFFWGRFSSRPGILRLRNGLQFWIRPQSSDRASITEVQMFHPYSDPRPGSVVVDIGANIGAFSLLASRTARRVYAVEPIPSNYEILCRNVQLNGAPPVTAMCAAISSENGFSTMSDDGVMSSLKWNRPDKAGATVRTITLKDFIQEHAIESVDFLKMDCEGAEWDILAQTDASVFGLIQHIEMEYHCMPGGPSPRLLVDRLSSVGFKSVTIRGGETETGIIVADRSASAT